ncbi:hypothetical protein NVP2096O_22 [Vibrio phage 2.096.O._10N.286.48.B5]|nr:hypothetical protein NVP2096O_22 [Vibrio phage 2.096.O._10N.286.48.B5]
MANQTRKSLRMQTQRVNGSIRPDSVDLANRTVEVVFTTGQAGKRWDWNIGSYIEELDVTPESIRTERLDKGLSVIGDHRSHSIDNVFGITESYRIENGELIGIVRFATDDESDKVFTKVQDGILRHFSLGYDVHTYEATVSPDEGGLDTYRATDWTPLELSIVAVSFETANGVRSEKPSDDSLLHDTNIIGDDNMKFRNQALKYQNPDNGDGNQLGGDAPAPVDTPAPVVAERQQAPAPTPVVDNRADMALMRSAVTNAGLPLDLALDAFERGVTPTQFNVELLTELGKRSKESAPKVLLDGERNDVAAKEREAITNAILVRGGIGQHDELSRNFSGANLMDLAHHLNTDKGQNTLGFSANKRAERAFNSTSDFPLILENVMHKTLGVGYEETPRTFLELGQRTNLTDFRKKNTYKMGDAPALLPLGENGEYKQGSISESKESYALETRARKLGFSRKMLINDDMNALTGVPRLFGQAASRAESDIVWGLLLNYDFLNNKAANHVMHDGKALYHADHNNLLTGAASALDKTSLSNMRKLGRKMKTLDGNFMNIMWNMLVVPDELETTAEDLLINSIIANTSQNANSFQGKYGFIVEPRLAQVSETAWLAFTNMLPAFEYAYLSGQEGVMTEVTQSTDVDGLSILARLDFGAGYADERGTARSNGK